MPKHTNKYGYLIFFLIIAIPSFFIIANTIISNSSYDISYKRELPISMMDNKWDKDDGDLNLQSPLDNGGKKWTILFYGAHDNDLRASIPSIGSNDDIDVIAPEDGLPWVIVEPHMYFQEEHVFILISQVSILLGPLNFIWLIQIYYFHLFNIA